MTYGEAMDVIDYLIRRGLRFYAWGPSWDWMKVEAHYCALVQGGVGV